MPWNPEEPGSEDSQPLEGSSIQNAQVLPGWGHIFKQKFGTFALKKKKKDAGQW